MKEWKLTTMPAVTQKQFAPKQEFVGIFNQVKGVLLPYENWFEVRNASGTHYELWTHHLFRTKSFRPKLVKGVLFAGVTILKHHVGLYFYPLHLEESLREKLSPTLRRALVGKSTFKLKRLPENFLIELNDMLILGVEFYRERKWIDERPRG